MAGTVLVTGASGRIGSRLLPLLRDCGYRVRALVHRHAVDGADEQVEGDLLDKASLVAATTGVEFVLHMAALTHARRPADYERFNVTGAANLLNAARAAQVQRFVYVSTRAISAAGGAYSASKLAAEELVRAAGLPQTTVRPPEVFGAGSAEGVDRMLAAAKAGKPVIVVGDGAQELCPAHVDDVLPAVVESLAAARAVGRTYTLAGECTTMRAFAERVVALTGSRSRIVSVPVPVVRGLGALSRALPLPLYPDQYARLTAPQPAPSPEAAADLGFRPRRLDDAIRSLAG